MLRGNEAKQLRPIVSLQSAKPESCNSFDVQVSTPADYTGPVTVTYSSAAASTSLSFTIMTQLTVKVTACSFST